MHPFRKFQGTRRVQENTRCMARADTVRPRAPPDNISCFSSGDFLLRIPVWALSYSVVRKAPGYVPSQVELIPDRIHNHMESAGMDALL
jgi:hypothetical protein